MLKVMKIEEWQRCYKCNNLLLDNNTCYLEKEILQCMDCYHDKKYRKDANDLIENITWEEYNGDWKLYHIEFKQKNNKPQSILAVSEEDARHKFYIMYRFSVYNRNWKR